MIVIYPGGGQTYLHICIHNICTHGRTHMDTHTHMVTHIAIHT